MYNPSKISTNIKLSAQKKKISVKQLLEDCEINKGFIYDLEHKSTYPSCDKMARIAEHLDCSVDFLLGLTDNPNVTNSISNSNTTINGTQANIINGSEPIDEMTAELVKKFNILPFDKKIEVFNYINKLLD